MMKLFTTPRGGDRNQEVIVQGETLFFDGVPYDLSSVPDQPGYAETTDLPFTEGTKILRVDGKLYVSIVVFYNEKTHRAIAAENDEDLVFDITDGPIPLVYEPIPENTNDEL